MSQSVDGNAKRISAKVLWHTMLFFYVSLLVAFIVTLLVVILPFPQYWGGTENKEKVGESLDVAEQASGSCGIEKPDDVQKNRAEMQQDEFAAEVSGCKKNGIYLEIGSHHPIDWSNTYLLDKRLNWSGFCVDPFPQGDFSIRNCQLDAIALASSDKPTMFDVPKEANYGGILKFKDPSDGGKKQMITPETPRQYFSRVNMPKVIDYMSIDVEGAENDILGAIDWKNFCARAITVEHNKNEPARLKTIEILTKQSSCKYVKTYKQDDFFTCNCG